MGRLQSPSQVGKDRGILWCQVVGQFGVSKGFLSPLGGMAIKGRDSGHNWNVVWTRFQSVQEFLFGFQKQSLLK